MKMLKIITTATLAIGMVSFLWLILDFAALTDIWHNREPNLDMEWPIVSYSINPLVLFHLSVFLTSFLLFGYLNKQRGRSSQAVS